MSSCRADRPDGRRPMSWLHRWFATSSLVAGIFALAWLLLRSGPRPSRFAYPCQQAALTAATTALGAPVVAAVVQARRQLAAGLRSPVGAVVALTVVLAGLAAWGTLSGVDADPAVLLEAPQDYRAQLYHVTDCAQDPVGDRFPGVDDLIRLMGSYGVKLHRSSTIGDSSGPAGIIAAGDVVLIKINYQWDERGGTNTDVLQGLIRAILDHPDTFTGEVVVCENAQFNSIDGFDRPHNNAQDHSLSPHGVVTHFQGLGYRVSHFDWTAVRGTEVDEFSNGDMADGYVLYPYDGQLGGRVSYPKFTTGEGTHVSLRDGIFDAGSGTYDRESLKLINAPVLKSHHATYGVTAAVKHYMGVVTGSLGTNSHSAIGNGILGALIAEIRPADLNILDCIWINADPFGGPWTGYSEAVRRDELVASTDPVALDIWATTNILIPAFLANGYSPPWPYPDATPDDPTSAFRIYLDRSMSYILDAGFQVTNDIDRIDAHWWDGEAPLPIFIDGFESGSTVMW